jgi:hypothetical protein
VRRRSGRHGVREHLGITAFGANVITASDGVALVVERDETACDNQEELSVVVESRARSSRGSPAPRSTRGRNQQRTHRRYRPDNRIEQHPRHACRYELSDPAERPDAWAKVR